MSEPISPPPPPGHGAPPPPPAAGDNRTLWLVLSYVWILALIPYLVEKNDAEVQWHSKNGLVWTIAELLVLVVLVIVGFVPVVGCFIWMLQVGIVLVSLVMRIVAIQKAFSGERFTLPGLGQFISQFP